MAPTAKIGGTGMDVDGRNEVQPARVRLSVKNYWPVAVIAAGLVVTAIWTVIVGWAAIEILVLVF